MQVLSVSLESLTTITGDTAEVDSYYVVVADDSGVAQIANYGRARTKFVRGPDGWIITARRAVEESPAAKSRKK